MCHDILQYFLFRQRFADDEASIRLFEILLFLLLSIKYANNIIFMKTTNNWIMFQMEMGDRRPWYAW